MGSRVSQGKKERPGGCGAIYENILTSQENGGSYVGWVRGVYPTGQTADALERDDLFVQEAAGRIVGAAIINRVQVDVYADVTWQYPAEDEQVMIFAHPGHRAGGKQTGPWESVCGILRGVRRRKRMCVPADGHQRPECERPALREAGLQRGGCGALRVQRHFRVDQVMLEKRISESKRFG